FSTRLLFGGFFLCHVLAFFAAGRIHKTVMGETIGSSCASVAAATLVWQWSRCRITRQAKRPRASRSIRHLMGLSVTIAILLALLAPGIQWAKLTSASVGLMLSQSMIWVICLVVMLSRRWWLIFTMPIVAGVCIMAVSFLIEADGRDFDADVERMSGVFIGEFFFGVLLLLLMRTGGHRWLG
ncbi:MAG: hypothetical protein AAGJ83_04545, partial [Planctomycetota bacterium]